jgi:hypothetical protein
LLQSSSHVLYECYVVFNVRMMFID